MGVEAELTASAMYALSEYFALVVIALIMAAALFVGAVVLISIRALTVRLMSTPVVNPFIRPLALNWSRPEWFKAWPFEPAKPLSVAANNTEVPMNKKWQFLLSTKGDHRQEQQSASGTSDVPETVNDAHDSGLGTATVPEAQPGGTRLMDTYREQLVRPYADRYSIWKVAGLLQCAHLQSLSREARRAAILVALEAVGVKSQDVIDDGIQRTRVLGDTERAGEKALEELGKRRDQENRRLLATIQTLVAEYDARIQRNNEDVRAETEKFAAWKREKTQQEQTIADALSYLTSEAAMPQPAPSVMARAAAK